MPGVAVSANSELLIAEFDALTANGIAAQSHLLQEILQQNACTDYLKDKLNGCTDVATFKSRVPLITYADIENDVQKIADGYCSSLLCHKPIDMFYLSAGTTKGHTKFIPAHDDYFLATVRLFRLTGEFRQRHYPLKSNGKVMDIVYCGKRKMTKGGIMSGTGTTHYFHSQTFLLKQTSTRMLNSSPSEVIQCSNIHQATYCHLLFGLLASEEISVISSTFVYTIVEAFRFLEKHWRSIAQCIDSGTLPDWITDPAIRDVASKHLISNVALANHLRSECDRGFQGIISRLWRNSSYVLSIMTGTMLAYNEAMRYYAGELPLVCGDYGSSESWMAINTDPLSSPHITTFTIVPDLAYFEFIPLERRSCSDENQSPSTLFTELAAPVSMEHVQIGHDYEIVVTTSSGLYRYRVGDVVRISGFYNAVPQFSYVCRRDVLLSIHVDKNGEAEVAMALEQSAAVLHGTGVKVADYTAHADMSFSPGHYVVFVELDYEDGENTTGNSAMHMILQEYCDRLDGSFVEPGYAISRGANTIGPLELCIVKMGTFRKLAECALDRGAALNQYKTPRCITAEHLLAILRAGVINRFHSCWYSQAKG